MSFDHLIASLPLVCEDTLVNGEMFSPRDAVEAGFLDKVVPPDQLMQAARAHAEQLKRLNMHAHRNTKLKVRKALLETLDRAIALDRNQTEPLF